ncbi:hypothetical protein J6590_087718 [Homalodisca vitripennis]|nr:hypothetical protein J6590_087718 [Homalodisca vitripennis]
MKLYKFTLHTASHSATSVKPQVYIVRIMTRPKHHCYALCLFNVDGESILVKATLKILQTTLSRPTHLLPVGPLEKRAVTKRTLCTKSKVSRPFYRVFHRQKDCNTISISDFRGKTIKDPNLVADIFNNFFVDVAVISGGAAPSSSSCRGSPGSAASMMLTVVTEEEVAAAETNISRGRTANLSEHVRVVMINETNHAAPLLKPGLVIYIRIGDDKPTQDRSHLKTIRTKHSNHKYDIN